MASELARLKEKAFQIAVQKLEMELAAPYPEPPKVQTQMKVITAKAQELVDALQKLLEELVAAGEEDEYLATEEKISGVQHSIDAVHRKTFVFFQGLNPPQDQPSAAAQDSRIHLPKLKLQEFTGNVRQWLPFWAGFEEIHNNNSIPEADKFQYLLQCIPANSTARKCIDSFPVCGKNYNNAVEALRNTYGREKMLIKVYVRDLLQLVIRNALQKTTVDLVELVPQLASQIRNLEELGVTSDKCEHILYPVVESCLPEEVLQAWQRNPVFEEKLEKLLEFLNSEVLNKMERSLARMDFTTTTTSSQGRSRSKNERDAEIPTASALANVAIVGNSQQQQCAFCGGKRHKSNKCYKAKSMGLKEKQEVLRKKRRCFQCLKEGHRSYECSVDVVCSLCSGKHFDVMCGGAVSPATLDGKINQTMMVVPHPTAMQGVDGYQSQLANYSGSYQQQQPLSYQQFPSTTQHPPPTQHQQSATTPVSSFASKGAPPPQQQSAAVTKIGFSNVNSKNEVAMFTMLVNVETPDGLRAARVFIDEGSNESYVEDNTAAIVKSERVGSQVMSHQLFGGGVTEPQKHQQLKIRLWNLNGSAGGSFIFNTMPKIAQSIPKPERGPWIEDLRLRGVPIHDQTDFTDEVQFMFGLDVSAKIWTGGFVRVNESMYARESIFGWIIGGEQPVPRNIGVTGTHIAITMMLQNTPEEELWGLEILGIVDESRAETKKELEEAALQHFNSSVSRVEDGRYQVRLPWIQGHKELVSNRKQAVARLNTLTFKLKKEGFLEQYDNIFQSWLADGIIEKVSTKNPNQLEYYMPHRHVIKENSTTPVRPVFDASAKTSGSVSLNDCLEKGPNLLELIPSIMARFRFRHVGVTADIAKAFLQMSIAEKDRQVLKFCWWKDLSCEEIVEFQHRRVVFGVTSSPFILAATLQYHLRNFGNEFPEVAEKLLRCFYVDNAVCSFDSTEEAEFFKRKSQELLSAAKFDLRGWEIGPSVENKCVPVLGMEWDTKDDCLSLCLVNTLKKLTRPATKRGLLSAVNSVFDPMGFVSPFTIIPKLLFQRCCERELKWDDALRDDISEEFEKWKAQVARLQKMKIPRWMCGALGEKTLSLHTFSDASSLAFSCCVFLRTETVGGVNVQLVMSKSRVAPIKQKHTIPRLELFGCLIGVRLTEEVKKYLEIPDLPCEYWTDSSTALAWIRNDKQWGRFVQNRVDEIRKFTSPEQWHHVPGECNPADLPSRGCMADRLLQLQWWEGPDWLLKPIEFWPKSAVTVNEADILAEVKKTVVSSLAQTKKDVFDNLRRNSSYHFSLRVVAKVLRYVDCLRRRVKERASGGDLEGLQLKNTQPSHFLTSTADEIERAERVILLYVQRTGFDGETDPRLKGFSSFKDVHGLLRIRSQLLYGSETYGIRCPVVLPAKHEVVKAMIQSEHEANCHTGVQTLHAILRNKFWILKGRRTISAVVNACPQCRRYNAKRCEVPSAPLPSDRIKDTCAFDVTGVDLLGPLFLRGRERVWVVLFTCAVYRCVHLEVTSTLSTEGFLKCFRRFVNACGRPSKVYSDNGLNFVGCESLFAQLDWEQVQRYSSVQRIEWVFNPPTAAWWGGWWERLVGLTKKLLRRILGKSVVNREDFDTILSDVQATLNKRPLGYVSDNDGDFVPLCPAIFMKGNPASGLPEADVIDSDKFRELANHCQQIREALRSRFRKEYLAQLQHHAGIKESNVKPGDVLIVEVDNKKRTAWPLGLVKEVYPGRNGKVYKALVKTKTGEFLRPVQRLFIMEGVPVEAEKEELEPEVDTQDAPAEKEERSRSGRKIFKPDRLNYKI